MKQSKDQKETIKRIGKNCLPPPLEHSQCQQEEAKDKGYSDFRNELNHFADICGLPDVAQDEFDKYVENMVKKYFNSQCQQEKECFFYNCIDRNSCGLNFDECTIIDCKNRISNKDIKELCQQGSEKACQTARRDDSSSSPEGTLANKDIFNIQLKLEKEWTESWDRRINELFKELEDWLPLQSKSEYDWQQLKKKYLR